MEYENEVSSSYLPYMQAWQHGSGATTKYPHSKKHNQKCGAEHHLSCISGSIANGQGKGHRTTKAYREQKYFQYFFNNSSLM